MASTLKTLYEELIRAFTARPSDLKKCTVVLNKLKVRIQIESSFHIFTFALDRSYRSWSLASTRRCKSWGPSQRSFVLFFSKALYSEL